MPRSSIPPRFQKPEEGPGRERGPEPPAPGAGLPCPLRSSLSSRGTPGAPSQTFPHSSACVFGPNQRVRFCSRNVKECKMFAVDSLIASSTSFEFYSSPQGIQRSISPCKTKTSTYCHFPTVLAGNARKILQGTLRHLQPIHLLPSSFCTSYTSVHPSTHPSILVF